MKHAVSLMCLAAVVLAVPGTVMADSLDPNLDALMQTSAKGEQIPALAYLGDRVDVDAISTQMDAARATMRKRHEVVVRALQAKARATQGPLLNRLQALQAAGLVSDIQPFFVGNIVAFKGSPAAIKKIANHKAVEKVYLDYPIEGIKPENQGAIENGGGLITMAPEIGLQEIRAPEVWALGYTGEGVLVSTLDTGVDGDHLALRDRWAGVADPRYADNPEWAWFDPVTNTTSPAPWGGHGTHTMGTVCGGAPGNEVGVAPGAIWIHAGVIDRVSISRTISDAILAFEWILDPDQNPSTNWDVPVTNSNSWGIADFHGMPDCDPIFWAPLDACEAAGITMIFSAGNEGNSGLRRPADRATNEYKSMAVAAVDARNPSWPIANFSSRGPTNCTPSGDPAIKPEISAPGVSTRSAWPGGGYRELSGTSMASPHINGVIALIHDANPNLTVQQKMQIIYDTAVDLGSNGKDNSYGYGMVDAFEAVQMALSMQDVRQLPFGVDVTRGVNPVGDVEDLHTSDDQYVSAFAEPVSEIAANSVELVLTGELTEGSPSEFSFVVETATTGFPAEHRIELYNYDINDWVELDAQDGPLSDIEISVTVSSNTSRYIQDGTNEVMARVGYRNLGVNFVGWGGRWDLAYWTSVP